MPGLILGISGMARGRLCRCGWKRAGAPGGWIIAPILMWLKAALMDL